MTAPASWSPGRRCLADLFGIADVTRPLPETRKTGGSRQERGPILAGATTSSAIGPEARMSSAGLAAWRLHERPVIRRGSTETSVRMVQIFSRQRPSAVPPKKIGATLVCANGQRQGPHQELRPAAFELSRAPGRANPYGHNNLPGSGESVPSPD